LRQPPQFAESLRQPETTPPLLQTLDVPQLAWPATHLAAPPSVLPHMPQLVALVCRSSQLFVAPQ
jgi:hypothetical protein